jgi:nicotinamide-nucleotide amidase
MNADIITIGDEILIGQVIDTNSAFIGSELTKIGINIRQILSVSDNETDILNAIEKSIEKSDLIIMTGGLGPTSDDITKPALLRYFGGNLVLHQESLRVIIDFFTLRSKSISERNLKQAEVPDTCKVLINRSGTAPGMMFKKDEKLVFSLPGVPFEMKELLTTEVIPFIKTKFELPFHLHRTILTEGIPESSIADLLKDWEENLSEDIRIAYLPSPGLLRLRVSISGNNEEYLNYKLNNEIDKVIKLIDEKHVFGYDHDTLEQKVGDELVRCSSTIAIAESCTGGKISNLITSVAGSSRYFKGSVIAYDNEIKTDILNIPYEVIENFGAVSEQVVSKMAQGVKDLMKTDFAVATSGIAGPGGGTDDKPIGTTWICAISPKKIVTKKFLFGENRERNMIRASFAALNMLRNLIKETI